METKKKSQFYLSSPLERGGVDDHLVPLAHAPQVLIHARPLHGAPAAAADQRVVEVQHQSEPAAVFLRLRRQEWLVRLCRGIFFGVSASVYFIITIKTIIYV